MGNGNMFIQGTHAFNDSKIPFVQARVLNVEGRFVANPLFENNCTVCGRGAPVQGAETLRQKTVCNVYTYISTIKKTRTNLWTYSKDIQNKGFIISPHPTTGHPHPLLLNNQLFIQRTGDGLSRA